MQRDDLPLFAWKPPCRVIPFPAAKQVGRIAHVAAKLYGRRGSERGWSHYWNQVVEPMVARMESAGLAHRTIIAEIAAFEAAVLAEVRRLETIEKLRSGK
ncbi:DUF6074 family protein [Shinella sumterensis]|nr:DUF6074 family protein [Shinella sumterensis]